jgi:hypothetical protein
MAKESILNTDILIRDRACIRFMRIRNPQKAYILSPKGGAFASM